MLSIRRLASYRPKGQGEAGYEAAKSDINRSDRHLFNRHSDGTGNEERPLRYESEPARRRSLSSQPTNLKGKRPGGRDPRHSSCVRYPQCTLSSPNKKAPEGALKYG
jgi:hypothetical protein